MSEFTIAALVHSHF